MSDFDSENARAWAERYSSGKKIWSGNPNALLVREVEELEAGRALDVGCGEGGDAIWLADQGWRVVGIDIAREALDLAAEHAVEKGVGDAITWERHDLTITQPDGPFDLVSACYFHSWIEMDRIGALRAAAGLIAPGGSLLVVGHAGSPSWVDDPDHPANSLPAPETVLSELGLPEGEWEVVTSDARVDVTMKGPDGAPATRPDNVLRVRRI